jgi:excisionase family DNA binding protein
MNADLQYSFIPVPYRTLSDLLEEVRQIREMLVRAESPTSPWLDAKGAADYLVISRDAIHALVKRRQIPFHKAPNGRLRFDRGELSAWVRREADQRW